MRLVGVEGLVVEGGHHLGHRLLGVGSGNDRRPSLLHAGLQFGGKTLPLDGEVLVGPRDVDLASRQVGPVLTNVSDVNGEPAAHGLGHLLLDACLCCPFVRPKGLQGLSSMDDLHECPSAPVARAPHGLERIARLDRPGGSGDVIGNLDGESLRFRIHHQNGQQSLDLLAEAILGLKNGPIGALLQLEGKFLVSLGVGGETLRSHYLTQFPRTGIGKIGLGLVVPSHPSAMKVMVALPAKPSPLYAFGFLESMNLKGSLGDTPLPIEGSGLEGNLDGIALGLPLLG